VKIHRHGKNYRLRVKKENRWVWINLGPDEQEAVNKAEELLGISLNTLSKAIRRYRKEVLFTKAEKTSKVQARQLDKLDKIFGHFPVDRIKAPHAIEYMDRFNNVSANREIALLRHVLTKCVHWGLIEFNPLRGLQYRVRETPRDRQVSPGELWSVMRQANSRERHLMWLIYLTGLRREDALNMTDMNIRQDGIHLVEGKTAKKVRIEWTPSLRKVIKRLQPGYFQGISESGIDSAWQRLRQKLKPYDLFQLKDLRAAHAGELEDQGGDATRQLGHSSRSVTQKHYLRTGRKVRPIK